MRALVAYDPQARGGRTGTCRSKVEFFENQYGYRNVDALILVTEWRESDSLILLD